MKELNPDKKIIYILNKYGYKKDAKTQITIEKVLLKITTLKS